ncbi:hypothetical protein OOJ91_12495 [Micromonospora lupini]|uniref:hypothetical protein n=1 Tax=Micromonospora lupini TaxID=285679 RepID=UPI002251A8DE|nr:hypothetical protein [Micromonospora lupini]MCX5066699.1 hypothetical protein [Micromonospora lupini]
MTDGNATAVHERPHTEGDGCAIYPSAALVEVDGVEVFVDAVVEGDVIVDEDGVWHVDDITEATHDGDAYWHLDLSSVDQ